MSVKSDSRDHFVYVSSQWERTLPCNIVSHWLGTYTKWSLWQMAFDIPNGQLGKLTKKCGQDIVAEWYAVKHADIVILRKFGQLGTSSGKWLFQATCLMDKSFLTHWPLGNLNEILDVIFKQILVIDGWGISCEIDIIWMSLDFTDDQSTLVQVMAWCRQATSHYLSQCWPRSPSLYGITKPQWVKSCCAMILEIYLKV